MAADHASAEFDATHNAAKIGLAAAEAAQRAKERASASWTDRAVTAVQNHRGAVALGIGGTVAMAAISRVVGRPGQTQAKPGRFVAKAAVVRLAAQSAVLVALLALCASQVASGHEAINSSSSSQKQGQPPDADRWRDVEVEAARHAEEAARERDIVRAAQARRPS